MDGHQEQLASRQLERVIVPRLGAVVRGVTPDDPPWRITDADGVDVGFARLWLTDLRASDYSGATVRAYAYDLLNWLRFINTVDVPWTKATRIEVRDWVRWHQLHENPQRRRSIDENTRSRPPAGSVNTGTGKSYLAAGYSRATVNRMLSSLSAFYEFAISTNLGPLENPVPKSRAQLSRENSHRSPMEPPRRGRRAPYRQKTIDRTPRALSDALYEQVFTLLRNDRDRAIIATGVSSGLRAGELLSMRRRDLHSSNQTVSILPKGGLDQRVMVPTSPAAFVWIARYLAARPPGPPDEPVWMALRGRPRPMTYWALRQVLERINKVIGTNITMHDFRHTFCMRLAEDENMSIPDLQELMRHTSITTTMVYLRPHPDDLVNKLQEHWNRPPKPPPAPAVGYNGDDLKILFGKGF